MSNTPHQLADEFPHDHALLHQLKLDSPHFVALSDRYQSVKGLKKQRLALIDEIAAILAKAKAAA